MGPEIDLKKLARDWLVSLGQAGLHDLPAGSNRTLERLLPVPSTEMSGSPLPADVATREPAKIAASLPAPERVVAGRVRESPVTAPSNLALDRWPAPLESGERTKTLAELNQRVVECTRCEELSRCRTKTVFGTGAVSPRLVFIGEAPGADEDRIGEPFVGAAGALLDRIIKACKMERSEVYILNTVKCRPPGNRNPNDREILNCQEFRERQLEILQPEFICVLGAVAARALLNTTESIGRIRGRFFDYRGSKVIVTYHPAYLLRTPEAKAKTWEDMKLLMRAMGVELDK